MAHSVFIAWRVESEISATLRILVKKKKRKHPWEKLKEIIYEWTENIGEAYRQDKCKDLIL